MNAHRKVTWMRILNHRRIVKVIVCIGVAALLAIVGQGKIQAKPSHIVVAIQGGNMTKLAKKHTDSVFEKRYGVGVKHLIGSHKDRLVKLRASVPNADFDVYFSKSNFISRAIRMNLLEPKLAQVVPGYDIIPDGFKTDHSVTLIYTAEGILYNPKHVKKPTSWAVLWDPKYKGKVGLSRFIDRMLMVSSLYATNGKRIDDEEAAWKWVEKLVVNQKGKLPASSEQLGQFFEQEEVYVAPYWQARAVQWKKAGIPLEFAVPTEGAISESWGFGIPRGTTEERKDLAGKWIGINLEPEVVVGWAKGWGYPSANPKVEYPEDIVQHLLSQEEFNALKHPDYDWIDENMARWTERFNKLLTR